MEDPEILTKRDVCKRYKIAERTLNGWMHRRLIPYRKIGRTVRFVRSEVEARIDSFSVTQRTRRA